MNLSPLHFRPSTLVPEFIDVKDAMKLDPFEKSKNKKNDMMIARNNFISKMENRVSRIKDVCSKFHDSYNGR